MANRLAVYADGLYGDGGLYESNDGIGFAYITKQEAQTHYLGLRFSYTATIIPGASEIFRIYSTRVLVAPDRQVIFTYNADVDAVVTTERVSLRITHTSSDLQINRLQLVASRKKHQQKG